MKTKVAKFGDLKEGDGLCIRAEGQALVLVKSEGAVYAVENRCPHLGVSLGGRIEGDQIVCRFHGSRFDIRTGENTDWVAAVAGVRIPALVPSSPVLRQETPADPRLPSDARGGRRLRGRELGACV